MNSEGFGRKRIWPNLGVILEYTSGTEENYENSATIAVVRGEI
jgi:hypothetical protein